MKHRWLRLTVGILLGFFLGYISISTVKTEVVSDLGGCSFSATVGCGQNKGLAQKGWPLVINKGETTFSSGNPFPENPEDLSQYPIQQSNNLNLVIDFAAYILISITLIEIINTILIKKKSKLSR